MSISTDHYRPEPHEKTCPKNQKNVFLVEKLLRQDIFAQGMRLKTST